MKNQTAVWSWAFYDFANTIYSAVVITVYLPLYATELAGRNAPVGLTATASMIAAGLLMPFLGYLMDRTGKAKRYLVRATLLCILATAALSFAHSFSLLLALFFLANILFHACIVFYNRLLPAVSDENTQGFVSGLGTALGYFGVVFSLPIAFAVSHSFGQNWVYLTAAVLFLIFSLPLFIKVPEIETNQPSFLFSFSECLKILKRKEAILFFLGNFFLVDSLNTAILWLSVFFKNVYLVSENTLILAVLLINFSAGLWGFLLGKLTDRWGGKQVMLLAAGSLGVTFIFLFLAGSFILALLTVICFGSFAIAGTWTAGRKLVIDIAPKGEVGSYFGFYGFTTKVSAFGSSVYAILADQWGYRPALLSQIIPVILAFILISSLKTDDLPPHRAI